MKNTVTTFEYTKIINKENISFGKNIIIDDFVFIYVKKKFKIGNYVHISCFTSIVGSESITIGDFCAISHGCRLFTSSDDFTDWGFGNPTVPYEFRNVKNAAIKIGNFSVIGANTVILPGVEIGEGATVGANSVITKNLEPWGVYIGNKKIKNRNKTAVLNNYKKFLRSNKSSNL